LTCDITLLSAFTLHCAHSVSGLLAMFLCHSAKEPLLLNIALSICSHHAHMLLIQKKYIRFFKTI